MSVGAALLTKDGCYVGCDSQATRGSFVEPYDAEKWRQVRGLTVIVSGSRPVLDYFAAGVARAAEDCSGDFVWTDERVKTAVSFTRAAMAEVGWVPAPPPDNNSGHPSYDVNALLTDGVSLWEVEDSMSAHRVTAYQPVSIGCGGFEAYVAMYTALYFVSAEEVPQLIVERGVEAACALDAHCGGRQRVGLVKFGGTLHWYS